MKPLVYLHCIDCRSCKDNISLLQRIMSCRIAALVTPLISLSTSQSVGESFSPSVQTSLSLNQNVYLLSDSMGSRKKASIKPSKLKSSLLVGVSTVLCNSPILRLASTPCKRCQSTNRSVIIPDKYSRERARFLNSCLYRPEQRLKIREEKRKEGEGIEMK